MKYNLFDQSAPVKKSSAFKALRTLLALVTHERTKLLVALGVILVNSSLTLATPFLIGHAVDAYVTKGIYHGVLVFSLLLLALYVVALITGYFQTKLMGGVAQRMLYTLRATIFQKLQALPLAFFNQNKAGDLISRINNDTDKLNQFFSQSFMQFIGSIVVMMGAGAFLLSINIRLGIAALIPAGVLVVFTRGISPWVKRKNAVNLSAVGAMSADIQENIDNFKVIIAFNRRDYFRERFEEVNHQNYDSAIRAGIANTLFTPVYGVATNIAQLIVLAFGITLIIEGHFTIGLLISFISYVTNFYNPLRQLAALWSNFQVAMAGWDRIAAILALESDLSIHTSSTRAVSGAALLTFDHVSFRYEDGKEVLRDVSFSLDVGKTYAFIGPTGGGKTTTASLMARLYDPTEGTIYLDGRDIRSFSDEERTSSIGFILQDPFLFAGTLRENILYGISAYASYSNEAVAALLEDAHLDQLLGYFDRGLATPIEINGNSLSLGQRQLIAFIRAVLRKPKLLILDEATANIDTVTEQLLDAILAELPAETTRVIIAHRLNTIENADAIYFVNAGAVTFAGSMEHAVAMLLHGKRES